jgi:hypothetical protein
MSKIATIVFSFKRPLQCDLLLQSLRLHCLDYEISDKFVLNKVNNERDYLLYSSVASENPEVNFIREADFRQDLSNVFLDYDYVLFLTDDSIFVEDFSLAQIIKILKQEKNALGFSLRLGLNTKYCYSMDKSQEIPEHIVLNKSIMLWDWAKGEWDFGYPFEVSSSVYSIADVSLFTGFKFVNPNQFEFLMDRMKQGFYKHHPMMTCFKQSVCFANPINKIRPDNNNRAGVDREMSVIALLDKFEQGYRADPKQFNKFVPDACHVEKKLELKKLDEF